MQTTAGVRIGTAGWTIPKPHREFFPEQGTHLARYAHRFSAVEINSTFYRSHQTQTYQRWAATVPEDFRFSVKVPKEITHELRLSHAERRVRHFLDEVSALDHKLGPLLVQLPPSLDFEFETVRIFLTHLRNNFTGDIVCEPRHPTWTDPAADRILEDFRVSRVVADPAVVPNRYDSSCKLIYYRLHGQPRIYFSEYSLQHLTTLAAQIRVHRDSGNRVWCIFDNTGAGAAAANGLELLEYLTTQSEDTK